MIFKKVELFGFKSFADKLEVDFSGGITCIVGPNGCGKSNIADAIRWVLGEQSSKALRGTNMQDVIFKGTEKRGSLSYCEVALFFDNTTRTFPVDYSEVVLSRKLYRSGESEYFINRNSARLKDIKDLLHDSGIDRDGFTIISQGQVAEIINSKPENRRGIFEEAAGIAKFKNRKTDAERKLEKTQGDIVRVNDVIGEIERNLGPMLKQAETAEKYLVLKEKLKLLEINAYIYQYDSASENKAALQTALDEISAELEHNQTELEQVIERSNSSMDEIAALDKSAEGMRELVLGLSLELERASGEKKLVQEKINLLATQDADIKGELARLNEQLEQERENRRGCETLHAELTAEREIVNKSLSEVSEQYTAKVEALAKFERASFENQSEMMTRISNMTDMKSAAAFLRAQRDNLLAKLDEIQKSIDEREIESGRLTESIVDKDIQVENYSKLYDEKVANLDKLEKRISRLSAEKTDLERILGVGAIEKAQLEARRRTIQNLIESGEGFKFSVRKIMEVKNSGNPLAQNVVGVVAQELGVPAEFETAIEVALGAAAQNIITEDEGKAKALVDILAKQNWGRATFLPLTSVRGRTLNNEERAGLRSAAGVRGVASELISYDNKIAPIVENLLGRVIITNDLDNAILLARASRYAFKIVTLDGDVIETRGSITGGSKNALNNNLWHTNNLAAIESELGELEEKNKRDTLDFDKINAELSELQGANDEQKQEIAELKLFVAQGEQLLAILKDEQNARVAEIKELRAKEVEANKTLDTVICKLEGFDDDEIDTKAADDDMRQARADYEKMKADCDIVHAQVTELKIKCAALDSEIIATAAKISGIVNTNLLLEKSIADKRATLNAINKNIDLTRELTAGEHDETTYKDTVNKLENAKTELASFDTRKERVRARISELETRRGEIGGALNALQEKFYRAEMALSKVDTDIATMQERIYEEYGLNYSSCYMFKNESFVLETALGEITDLKKQIARLGNVNLDAIEDSKTNRVRYDSYKEQVGDLVSAKEDLEKVIRDLSVEMESKFKADFNKINHNFQFVFKELFNGGNARLVLTEPNDYLSSGIDIIAEPPGKKLQNITLLSGGEKALTAIAILFAILKLRPMPFCLLDEIEAALDDANVGRFASYLQKFSATTQFIVITHRKPTMELADNLYGVTMEEKGVSKLVSVKLEGWAANETA